jgi:hypothetical protein
VIIVVSGTHASGKTSLIDDFASAHPDIEVLPDPYELLDDTDAGGGSFFAQLRIASARLIEADGDMSVIAERGPLDFLAYLDALETLGRPERAPELFRRGLELCREAMAVVDLLVVLPLNAGDHIHVPDDEDPELREAMDAALLEFIEDDTLTGGAAVIELSGTPAERLAQLEAVSTRGRRAAGSRR